MRDGLAREFPGAARALATTRQRLARTTLSREGTVWAAVCAIGAGFLVSTLVRFANAALFHLMQAVRADDAARLDLGIGTLAPLVTVFGGAATAAVALAVGGVPALALALAYDAAGIGLRIPGLAEFCARSGGAFAGLATDRCTPGGFLTTLWPELVGLGLGIALARVVATQRTGTNTLLRVAGALAMATFAQSALWGLTVARTADPAVSGGALAAGTAAAGVAAGVVAAQLPRGVRSAAVVAAVWLLPWLTLQLPLTLQSAGAGVPDQFALALVLGAVSTPVAAALLVIAAIVTARSRFVPRDPASVRA